MARMAITSPLAKDGASSTRCLESAVAAKLATAVFLQVVTFGIVLGDIQPFGFLFRADPDPQPGIQGF